jgi:hypothetical protein
MNRTTSVPRIDTVPSASSNRQTPIGLLIRAADERAALQQRLARDRAVRAQIDVSTRSNVPGLPDR